MDRCVLLEFGVYDTCREPCNNVSNPFRILHNHSAKVKKAVACASDSVERFNWTRLHEAYSVPSPITCIGES